MLEASACNRNTGTSTNTESGFDSTIILTEDCISCILFHTRSFEENRGLGTFSKEARPVVKLHVRRVVQRKTGRSSFTSTHWFVALWTKLCLPRSPEQLSSMHIEAASMINKLMGKVPGPPDRLHPSNSIISNFLIKRKPTCIQKWAEQNRQWGQLLASKLPLCN